MPFRPGTHDDPTTFHHEGVEIDAFFLGPLPVWAKESGSAAVDIVLGPLRQLGLPSQIHIQITIAGTPFPRWIRMTPNNASYAELDLQADFEAQSGSRRIVQVALLQVEDVTPTGIPVTYTVKASNGRTTNSATFEVTWPQR